MSVIKNSSTKYSAEEDAAAVEAEAKAYRKMQHENLFKQNKLSTASSQNVKKLDINTKSDMLPNLPHMEPRREYHATELDSSQTTLPSKLRVFINPYEPLKYDNDDGDRQLIIH